MGNHTNLTTHARHVRVNRAAVLQDTERLLEPGPGAPLISQTDKTSYLESKFSF